MRHFDHQQVQDHLSMKDCIQVIQDLFRLPAEAFLNPLRPIMRIPSLEAVVGMMPAYIAPYHVLGVKVLSIFHHNHAYGISSHQGVMLLFEAKHGVLMQPVRLCVFGYLRTPSQVYKLFLILLNLLEVVHIKF